MVGTEPRDVVGVDNTNVNLAYDPFIPPEHRASGEEIHRQQQARLVENSSSESHSSRRLRSHHQGFRPPDRNQPTPAAFYPYIYQASSADSPSIDFGRRHPPYPEYSPYPEYDSSYTHYRSPNDPQYSSPTYAPGDYAHSTHSDRTYVAVDPFRPTVTPPASRQQPVEELGSPAAAPAPYLPAGVSVPAHPPSSEPTGARIVSAYLITFLCDTAPRQLYLYFLLGLPSLYFSRVTRIFEEAELSMPEIKRIAMETVKQRKEGFPMPTPAWDLDHSKLRNSWENFIDSLMREWKTQNVVSVLLLS